MLNRIDEECIQRRVCLTRKNISNLLSVNFSTTKQIKEVKQEVIDLRKSTEFTENQLEEKVNNDEYKLTDIKHQIEEIYDYQIDLDWSSQADSNRFRG